MDVFAKDRKALVVCGTPGQDMSTTKGNNSGALWLFEQSKASFVCVGGKWKVEWDKLDVPLLFLFFSFPSNQWGGSLETNERSEEHTWEGMELPSLWERPCTKAVSNELKRVPLEWIPLWHVRSCKPAAFEHLFVRQNTIKQFAQPDQHNGSFTGIYSQLKE